MAYRFLLTGPYKGKTMPVSGHEFVDGEYVFHGDPAHAATLARVFSFYGALPAAEAELLELRAESAKAVEPAKVVKAVEPAKVGEPKAVEPAKVEEPKAVEPAKVEEPKAVEPAKVEEPKAVEKVEPPTLAEAVGMLDPANDAHWTSNNLPSLDLLSELVGKKISRSEVEEIAGGYTRAKARQARA